MAFQWNPPGRKAASPQIELFPNDDYPFSTLKPIEMVVGWGREWHDQVWALLATIPATYRKWQFLDTQIRNPEYHDHPQRDAAIERRRAYRTDLTKAIDQVIWCEYHTQESVWTLLTPAQRHEHRLDWLWLTDADEPSIIGVVRGWPGLKEIDLKAYFGPRNDLVWVTPYRWEIHEYVQRGWLDPPSDHAQWQKEQSKERQRIAAINENIRKAGRW